LQCFVAKKQELNFAFSKTGNSNNSSNSFHCGVPAVAATIKAAGSRQQQQQQQRQQQQQPPLNVQQEQSRLLETALRIFNYQLRLPASTQEQHNKHSNNNTTKAEKPARQLKN